MLDESREPPGKPVKTGVGLRSMKERGTNGSRIWLLEEFRGNLWAHSPRTCRFKRRQIISRAETGSISLLHSTRRPMRTRLSLKESRTSLRLIVQHRSEMLRGSATAPPLSAFDTVRHAKNRDRCRYPSSGSCVRSVQGTCTQMHRQ
jgi:hypothetical protein